MATGKVTCESGCKGYRKGAYRALCRKAEQAGICDFGPDTEMQDEFEAMFEWPETDGQLQAASEIKKDMQDPHPMDRLLCGDVGFGKTEVALRAAFKAVDGGKQVAVLVPTTILRCSITTPCCRDSAASP